MVTQPRDLLTNWDMLALDRVGNLLGSVKKSGKADWENVKRLLAAKQHLEDVYEKIVERWMKV